MGRGDTLYCSLKTNVENKESFLGSFANKTAIFKAIAVMYDPDEQENMEWPMYLPSIHHALITTCQASDSLPSSAKDADTEKMVCSTMLTNIKTTFADPKRIVKKGKENKASNIQVSDEEVLLSLRDARFFVLCLLRLPQEDQKNILGKLLSLLSFQVNKLKNDDEELNLVILEKECSGFLARVITLISIVIDAVSVGQPLLISLADYVGPLRYYLPSIIEVDSESDVEENDWYRSESCFMGLWEEWESSALPPVEINGLSHPLSSGELETYKSILEAAIEIGFDCGK